MNKRRRIRSTEGTYRDIPLFDVYQDCCRHRRHRPSRVLAAAAVVLGIFAFATAGCGFTIHGPQETSEVKATEPAHTYIEKSWFGSSMYNSKDFAGSAKFNPDTGEFEVTISDIASKVNETLVPMLVEINKMMQTQNEGLASVERQLSINGQTLIGVGAQIASIGVGLTNIPGSIVSALTGNPVNQNAPPPLAAMAAPQQPAIDEADMRRIIREELRAWLDEHVHLEDAGHVTP